MSRLLPLVALTVFTLSGADDPPRFLIWPNDPMPEKEGFRIGPGDTHRRIINVTRPTITPFLPEKGKAGGAGVIILPGGGFRHLAIDKEGHDVARALNAIGIAGFVVRYRVSPQDQNTPEARDAAIQASTADTLEALRIVRARAAEFGVDPNKVGVMGFSAGGYLAVQAAASFTAENRPAFAAGIYAGIPKGLRFPESAPPLFLLAADDDRLAPKDNSVPIYLAAKAAKIPVEMHILKRGGHGFGMSKQGAPTDDWFDRLAVWLADLGLVKK